MQQGTYTKDLLRALRNNVSINYVILDLLAIPAYHTHKRLSFQCPCCKGWDTATKTDTNLARCFNCNRNFNPIDLVITARGLSFHNAVQLLTPLLANQKTAEPTLERLVDVLKKIAPKAP